MSNSRMLSRRGLWYGILVAILLGNSGCTIANQIFDTIALALNIADVWI